MPIHHNKDGTWQWGQAGKRYRSRKDAIRQMRAIFANGYKQQQDKKASFQVASRASQFLAAVASVGSYGMVKRAANKFHQSYTPVRGDGWLKLYKLQKSKNALVPSYEQFIEDAKRWNNGAIALKAGRPIRMPIYKKDMPIKPTPFVPYGKDAKQWDTIQRMNQQIADQRARIFLQSRWNANAVSPGGKAHGLSQMQQSAVDWLNRDKNMVWTIKDASQLQGKPYAALYGHRKLIESYNKADPTTGRQAIDAVAQPQRTYYRYTRGANAHYNYIQKLRQQGVPQAQIIKITQKSLAQKDPRVKRFMQLRAKQRALMPKRPVIKTVPVSTPITK